MTTAANTNTAADPAQQAVHDALAAQQRAVLPPDEAAAAEALRVGTLPLGQLVDHLLDVIDEGSDADTGEVRAEALDVIDALNLSINAKVQAYAHVVDRLKAEGDAFLGLATTYKARAEARAAAIKRIKGRLMGELQRLGLQKLKTPTVTAYLQNSAPAVELTALSDDDVPDEYCVTERRVSVSKIASALKAGAQLAFAQLTQSQHLRFR